MSLPSVDPCSITKARNQKLKDLGVDVEGLQKKMDDFAKQANHSFDIMDAPIIKDAIQNFNNAVSATVTGAVGELSKNLAAKLGQSVTIISAALSVILMVASAGTQVQALLASQLKREVAIRIYIFRMLLWHYQNVQVILNLLKAPTSISYTKLLAVLPYVRKAERLFGKVVLAESTGDLPARYSYSAIKNAFSNIDIAIRILTSDGSEGGKQIANAIEQQFGGIGPSKSKTQALGTKIARDLVVASIAKSLSYIETITWNFTMIAGLLPVPYEVGNTIFKPVSYVDSFLEANGSTDTGVVKFNQSSANAARIQRKNTYMVECSSKLGKALEEIDVKKGLVPTTVLINSLMSAIIDFPDSNLILQKVTSDLLTMLMPLVNTIQNVREGMEQAIAQRDNDLVVTGKEAIWTSALNGLLAMRRGILSITQGQGNVVQDAYSIQELIVYLQVNQDTFVIAENMPNFILKSLSILRAPFTPRALEEGLVLSTFMITQLKKAIQQDLALLNKCNMVGEPLTQFSQLLTAGSSLPAPVSTICNALKSGQISQILGFVTAITLGTYDQIKKLFGTSCAGQIVKEDPELAATDARIDERDKFFGQGSGQAATTGLTTVSLA